MKVRETFLCKLENLLVNAQLSESVPNLSTAHDFCTPFSVKKESKGCQLLLIFLFRFFHVADCLCFAFSHALCIPVPYQFSLPVCQSKLTLFHLKGAIFLLFFSLLQHVWALHWPEASPFSELGTEQNIQRHFFWLSSCESFVLLGQNII